MKTGEVIRKKIDNDDGTITLVFYINSPICAAVIGHVLSYPSECEPIWSNMFIVSADACVLADVTLT